MLTKTPVIPPKVNIIINDNENNIGTSNLIRPAYNVVIQLNTFIPLGIDITNVIVVKATLTKGLIPVVYIW